MRHAAAVHDVNIVAIVVIFTLIVVIIIIVVVVVVFTRTLTQTLIFSHTL